MATFVADALLSTPAGPPAGTFVDLEGGRCYRVSDYDAMPPFFMSLVSDADHWLFLSSNGALTAGRRDPDHALFPYVTDDRIHDSQEQTGCLTVLRVLRDGRTSLWEPFSSRCEGLWRVTRSLAKSVHGNRIQFEEVNHDLGLAFRYEWMSSEAFGFVRRATLEQLGGPGDLGTAGSGGVRVEVLDGLRNLLPAGLERRFQLEFSTLADGYKRTERVPGSALALFRLSSIPVDKAEPSEALRVNAAWSTGLAFDHLLLSEAQVGAFRRGGALQDETDVRGRRGAYLLHATLDLEPGLSRDWLLAADVDLDACGDPGAEVLADVDRGTRNLVRIVAGADGLQATGDELATWRHFSNTLFNAMRGGVPDDGYRIPTADLVLFLARANAGVAARHGAFLAALPPTLAHADLCARVLALGDPDLERLAFEYLPLTFSRRHGDPSRPWNVFSIRLKDDRGRKLLNYEGNWRDLFQNWEALGFSYPGWLESMIFKFLDASTADGYNPYRVMRDGYEWEAVDPDDPWSFIGYWGDHQVIYLLKLLEASGRYHPERLGELLDRRVFTYAAVPYRLKPYDAMLAEPRSTIDFDRSAHHRALALAETLGSDGKALQGPGGPVRATLVEKLLVVALSKLSAFVPEAGIWMNTQRPEWNDANNALVGYGVSVVTLCYLRRYLAFCRGLLEAGGDRPFQVSRELMAWLEATDAVLREGEPLLAGPVPDEARRAVLDGLGRAGSAYRDRLYREGLSGATDPVPAGRLVAFCARALRHVEHAIRANRREDGLYHAYNLMRILPGVLRIRRLPEMLEGQVAVLSSGALDPEAAADLLDALGRSRLYREDQESYVLYPDRALPRFLELNTLPAGAAEASPLLSALLAAGDPALVVRDVLGQVHFNADFRNAGRLAAALGALEGGVHGALARAEAPALLDLYERVFDHQSFTGRSGAFYKYEGLGCIYWHMVSKLLLAVDEVRREVREPGLRARLDRHFAAIREGLGVHKSPARYGAIPTDPYSHTPSFAGVQQPGMTGQVKEDFLTRFSELGVQVTGGILAFDPRQVVPAEFLAGPGVLDGVGPDGAPFRLPLEAGTLAFTLCQVPVVLHRAGPAGLLVQDPDGGTRRSPALALDAADSAALFGRTGRIARLDVFLDLGP
jgi:hypothetical protein